MCMNEDEIMDNSKIQMANMEILKEIDRVCAKYNIIYYLDCGALLGAVRHKSFIPWDDDVDISFTRENYEKFIKATESEWKNTKFCLKRPVDFTGDKWLDFVTRVVNKECKYELNTYDKIGYESAKDIWGCSAIDVFVLDNIPDDKKLHDKMCRKITIYYGMLMGHRNYIDYSEYGFKAKIVIGILSKIGKMFSVKTVMNWYTSVCKKYANSTGKYYFYSNFSLSDIHKKWDREWYGNGTRLPLDNVLFNTPINYDKVLKTNYGNYMELPPIDKRIPKHLKK